MATLEGATHEAVQLLEAQPELYVVDEYSVADVPCERFREQGPFRPGAAAKIVQALGYS